jgi:hypothetical protein
MAARESVRVQTCKWCGSLPQVAISAGAQAAIDGHRCKCMRSQHEVPITAACHHEHGINPEAIAAGSHLLVCAWCWLCLILHGSKG